MTADYDEVVAARWDRGAGVVYRPLADALVAATPVVLDGARVLDAGSGTGAAASAALARGASVVAVDLSASMLAAPARRRWPSAVCDVLALPFGGGNFDLALAAFVLNHLDPEPALLELARTVRPAGAVMATTWAFETDPVKAAATNVLIGYGWHPPAWYQDMKTERDALSGDPGQLARLARRAGLVEVECWVQAEPLGIADPAAFATYRLSTPQLAGWYRMLDGRQRHQVAVAVSEVVAPLLGGWRPAVVFLRARVAPTDRVQPRPRALAARASASR